MIGAVAMAFLAASVAPALAFNMRQARQAVENLGQWAVLANACGNPQSAEKIRQSLAKYLDRSNLTPAQRDRLNRTYSYWVKTSNGYFRTGAMKTKTACPIWHETGPRGVDREFARLRKHLG